MKVALLTAQSRVSPVFETTQTWLAINASLTECNVQNTRSFNSQNETEMVDELLKENVEMVICGALPFYIEESLINQGCEVFAFIAGDVNDVVNALNLNILDRPKFKMPGCQKRKRRRNNFCINKNEKQCITPAQKEKDHASNE